MDQKGILMHMRTTLNIDDDLLKEAQELSEIREKTATVRAALEALGLAVVRFLERRS